MLIKGFSLIELMVTVGLVAILMSVAVPSFKTMTSNSRIKTDRDKIIKSLQFARSEAISKGLAISVCPSENPESRLSPTCSKGSTDWSDGWLVYSDGSDSADTTIVEVLRQVPIQGDHIITFAAGANEGGNIKDHFRFLSNGMLDPQVSTGTFSLCPRDNVASPRSVVITPSSGQVKRGSGEQAQC